MLRNLGQLVHGATPEDRERIAAQRESATGGEPLSYGELADRCLACVAGLRRLGIAPGDRVGIYADNSIRWLITDLACLTYGAVDVPRGADTHPDEMTYILGHSGCKVLFVENEKLLRAMLDRRDQLPEIGAWVVMDPAFTAEDPGASVLSMTRLMEATPEEMGEIADGEGPERDSLATIVYTSGTTGKPKGVMLTHGNILHNVETFPSRVRVTPEDCLLSILPSWHMFERTVEYCLLISRARIIYTDKRRFKKDLAAERPTLLITVPRMWEVLHDAIRKEIDKQGEGKRKLSSLLFQLGRSYRAARRNLEGRCLCYGTVPLWRRALGSAWGLLGVVALTPAQWISEQLLFRKIRVAVTGGHVHTAVSGGGALRSQVEEFFETIGIPILNGYGLTETAPMLALRDPRENVPGTMGLPMADTVVQARNDCGEPLPVGEEGVLFARGPQIMKGYYRQEEETRAVLGADGWFNTGDLGRVCPGGHLVFTGRCKDTIVLSSGENVQPSPIECRLEQSPWIEHAVVVGQDQRQLGVLIDPNREALYEHARKAGLTGEGTELHESEAIQSLFRKEIERICSPRNGFRAFEVVRSFRILPEPLGVENGTMTPTLKVKKPAVSRMYADLIQEMYP